MFVQLINVNERKVITTKDYKTQRGLESNLRGHSADIVLVHGLDKKDINDNLLFTLKAIIVHKDGAVIIVKYPVWRSLLGYEMIP